MGWLVSICCKMQSASICGMGSPSSHDNPSCIRTLQAVPTGKQTLTKCGPSALNFTASRVVRNDPLSYSGMPIEKRLRYRETTKIEEVVLFELERSLEGSRPDYSQLVVLLWTAGRPSGGGKSWWKAVAVRKHLRGNLAPSLAAPSPFLDLPLSLCRKLPTR